MSQFSALTRHARLMVLLTATGSLCACATQPPPSPSFAVLPKAGESFADFQQHDTTCRSYALNASGATTKDADGKTVVKAAAGAGLGAAAGALIGSASGHAGGGAAIGAGSGLLLGSIAGAQGRRREADATQRRYDIGYAQCMVANGEQVPSRPAAVVYAPPPVVYAAPSVVYGPPPPY